MIESFDHNETEIKRPVLPDRSNKQETDPQDHSVEKTADEKSMNNLVEIRERLGFGLRSMYRSVLDEPLPSDMIALLDRLDENEEFGENPPKSSRDQRD